MYRNEEIRSRRHYYRPTLIQEIKATWVTSLIGTVVIWIGLWYTFWNEGRAVKTYRSLDEGYRKIIVPQTLNVVFEENNGKLVLVAGSLNIEDKLEDPGYGISIQAVKVKKRVQQYQWYEIEDEKPDTDFSNGDHKHMSSYSYDKDWFEEPIDSNTFHNPLGHHNPEYWPVNSTIWTNARVKIGGFMLGKDLKEKFDSDFVPFTADERPPHASGIKMHAGLYFHCRDVWNPEVGDLRVQFSYAGLHGDTVTVIGRQSGREIRPYQTENGEELLLMHHGIRKVDQVFQVEHAENRFQTWMYRLFGWLISFIGFSCVGSILDILVEDYPFVRTTLALGITNLSFSFSISTTLVTIGLGWLIYRPLLGFTLLIVAFSPFALAGYQLYRRRSFENRHRLS